jgi:hypothetical protein
MGVPSAAVVYTGAAGEMSGSGKGAAYSEDISSSLENMNQWLKDIREDEKLRKEEQQKKNNAWNTMLEKTPDVWNLDFEKVKEKSLAYNDYVRSLREQGYNPYDLPAKESRELERLKTEVIRETNAAKANKEYWDKNTFNIDEDAGKTWNQEYATKWFEQYADPNLTPSERAKIRQQGKPYQKNVDLTNLVYSIGEKMEEQKLTQGGYDITGRDKEDFKKLMSIYFNDQSGMEDYEALMNSGKYKDDADLMKKAEEIFEATFKADKTKRSTTKQSREDKEEKESGYGTGNWDGKLTITYGNDAAYPAANKANAISITRTASNDNLPFLNLQDDNGNLIQFQPTAFYLKGNEISIRGFKKQGGKDVDSYISYNKNKQALKAQMNGYDVMEDFIQKNNSTDNTDTSTGTGSTGGKKTMAELMREQNK